MRVRVELAGVVFYAQTRQWTQDRVCITWHDDSYSYRTAWVPATAVRVVAYEEYLAAESARFQRAARLPAAD